jgi:hypothetical protein
MMEAIFFSETSVLTRALWHHIPEGSISHSFPIAGVMVWFRLQFNILSISFILLVA